MLSDLVLMELARKSPLREELIRTAWPSLSTESKLDLVNAVVPPRESSSNTVPGFLLDLALSDSAAIVRYWAARSYYFNKPHLGPDGRVNPSKFPHLDPRPEEYQRTARVEGDRSELVRAAASAMRGIGLGELVELAQLERLIKIRALHSPATESLAEFVEKALAQGVANSEIAECMSEYFDRQDVRGEVLEMDDDGGSEFSKQRGWAKLWTIAATAPIEVGRPIAWYARLEGVHWKIDLDKLNALPDKVKKAVVWRDEEAAQTLREAVTASPDKYSKEVLEAVRKYDEMRAEYGGRWSKEKAERLRLDSMPNRLDAIFDSVKRLNERLELQGEAIASLAKETDVAKATQRIVNWVLWAAIGLGLVLIYFAPRH